MKANDMHSIGGALKGRWVRPIADSQKFPDKLPEGEGEREGVETLKPGHASFAIKTFLLVSLNLSIH